ncbi:MAG: OsmC family protein [Verrucomicrobiales bacterium]|nr:OsmC family protein [Verrucomicrobiales bacterium]
MSEHRANLTWKRGEKGFAYKEYPRDHRWDFPSNGQFLNASAAPKYMGSEDCVDPEEAYVAALASCHMLTFLAVSSMSGYVVDSYTDVAVGKLAPNENKKMVITQITMNPVVQFSGDKIPDDAQIEQLHQKAHQECFLANSVNTEITWH